jgi:Xaa-Pro aminopeptidase
VRKLNEIEKACSVLNEQRIDIAILSSIENATYTSGFEIPLHSAGLSCIGKSMPLVVTVLDVASKKALMVACEEFRAQVEASNIDIDVIYYLLFGNLTKTDNVANFYGAFENAMHTLGAKSGRSMHIGIEFQSCPYFITSFIERNYPDSPIEEITPLMEKARSTKTQREIEKLRGIAALLDAGQAEFNHLMRGTDATEFGIFKGVKDAIDNAAGRLIPVSGELVMGERTNAVKWPGGPINRTVSKGDSGILDISPRLGGYWGDCSNAAVFGGEPSAKQKQYFYAVKDTFDLICGFLRPGIACSKVASRIIDNYAKYGFKIPHYCGHQVGVSVNEEPRFVPYDHTIIEEGMVFCLELGLYEGAGGTTGVRLEKMLRITQGGCELLNLFQWGIDL